MKTTEPAPEIVAFDANGNSSLNPTNRTPKLKFGRKLVFLSFCVHRFLSAWVRIFKRARVCVRVYVFVSKRVRVRFFFLEGAYVCVCLFLSECVRLQENEDEKNKDFF